MKKSNDNFAIVTDDLFLQPLGNGYVAQGYRFKRGSKRGYWGVVPAGHWLWEIQYWRDEGGLEPVARGTAPTMAEASAAAEVAAAAEVERARRGAA
jgi:hypothetical protein